MNAWSTNDDLNFEQQLPHLDLEAAERPRLDLAVIFREATSDHENLWRDDETKD